MGSKIIAVDGPSGCGKGTIARAVAKRLGFHYLDTGLFYRSIAYLVLTYNIDIKDEKRIQELANDVKISFKDNLVLLNGESLGNELRSNEVNNIVAPISKITNLRLIINDKIRNYCNDKDTVVDGRDIASVVFPNADVKIFLDASIDTRARRRFNQNNEMGIVSNFEDILNNLKMRDEADRTREFGALVKENDAYLVDTTNKEVEESINEVISIIEGELK